jgi:hypothetical protein
MSLRGKKFLLLIQALGLLALLADLIPQAHSQTSSIPSPPLAEPEATESRVQPYDPGEGCLPGIPCLAPRSENRPNITTDGPNQSDAPNNALRDGNPMCDADFMNQIYGKAFLEASREHIMGQAVIRKPDSILEYVCFDQLLDRVGDEGGKNFSETDVWRGPFKGERTKANRIDIDGYIGPHKVQSSECANPVKGGSPYQQTEGCSDVRLNVYMNRGRLNLDLGRLVATSMEKYLENNFDHTFLGGEMSEDYAACDINYVCNFMNIVYLAAKCRDMNVDDPFMKFEELVGLDPRYLPRICENPDGTATGTGFTRQIIDLAKNTDSANPRNDFQYVNFDETNANYLALYQGDGTRLDDGTTVRCSDPVPTGIKVKRVIQEFDNRGRSTVRETQRYNDMVCINPGCSFDHTSGKCVATPTPPP